ncbi:MAG: branched-chain amino acid transaminase [Actinocatenispora sp.]
MTAGKSIWLDGELVAWDEAQIHVTSFGLHYGIGFFEGVRSYRTDTGPVLFRLRDHIKRLARSAATYMVRLPYDPDTLSAACHEVVRANGLEDAYLRPIVFLGTGENPFTAPYRAAVIAHENGPMVGTPKTAGVHGKISSFQRLASNSIPPAAKATGQYLNSMLAQTEAVTAGFDEALLLNSAGYVTDGWAHNVFAVLDGALVTPPVSAGALAGIVRDTVCVLAEEAGLTVRVENLTRTDLYLAEECFLTGTAAGITPLISVDRRPVGGGQLGPVTIKLAAMLDDVTRGRNSSHPEWRESLQ